jgi:acyl dehydratase
MITIPFVGAVLKPWRHEVRDVHAAIWSTLLQDPNPIHLDGNAAHQLGIGTRPVNQGPANISYLYNMLAESLPDGRVVALDARMTGSISVGDLVEVTGRITAVEDYGTGTAIRCALVLRSVPDGAEAVVATAEVRLEERVQ